LPQPRPAARRRRAARCPERHIRSDALDGFVFDQVRQALLRPQVLLAGERAVAVRAPAPDDQLLAAQLAGWTARPRPPRPNAVAWSTATRRG